MIMSIEIIDLLSKDDIAIHLPSRPATSKKCAACFQLLALSGDGDSEEECRTFQPLRQIRSLEAVENQQVVFNPT
jgi:hypothetical protein